jgi:pyruvate dehydrogenase E1 component
MENIKSFRDKFSIPVSDDEIESIPYVRPAEDSPEIQYLKKTRQGLGGSIPRRRNTSKVLSSPNDSAFSKLYEGTGERKISTTMAAVRVLTDLLKDKEIGKRIVPIVPDEARTFGMEALFRQVGIYSSAGQNYEPEDADKVMWYKESKEGVMLEEGITEAGAFSAWSALATAYSNYDYPMIPFYLFYSMFGFQRIHDLAWAAGDAQAKGFLIGATSGRTTLNGEGLQHQDGHSHILSSTIPNCLSYDPAFSYEVAVIIKDGIQKMYVDQENYFYYITTTNENYEHPPMPKDSEEGIIKGMYKILGSKKSVIRLLGSGAILRESIKARDILSSYKIESEVWSVTSFNLLRKDGMEVERFNQLNPSSNEKKSYVEECFSINPMPVIASTDYMRSYADQIRPYINEDFTVLGTDGFGRSDSREMLREFFEIDANSIVRASAYSLYKSGNLEKDILDKIYKDIGVDSEKVNPWEA